MSRADEAMWCVVMFDLPVKTKQQRREATQYRNLLLDQGFQMAQFSVYVRFSPSVSSLVPALNVVKTHVPHGGEVRFLYVTDRQWAKTVRIVNEKEVEQESEPEQLTIF